MTKRVVTLGFGFADGTKYIPTLGFGFSSAAPVVVAAPERVGPYGYDSKQMRKKYAEMPDLNEKAAARLDDGELFALRII